MNTNEMLSLLASYLQEYGNYNFYFHKSFLKEFSSLAKKVSYQQTFFNQLVTVLNNIREHRHNIYNVDSHEHLTGSPYYSIHMKCKNFNIRLLICFSKEDHPLFLVAFYERSGKGKTGYANHLPVAETRHRQLLKEISHEK